MYLTFCIEGINLEKLLRAAPPAGVTLHDVRRIGLSQVYVRVLWREAKALWQLCARFGWDMQEVHAGASVRAVRFMRRRGMLGAAMLLCAAMVYLSSQMILAVDIENAQENVAEVRRFLQEAGVRPGRMKAAFSTDDLRARLALRVPGLAFAGLRYEGSTLVIDCHPAHAGEQLAVGGGALDIVATREGIITRISVSSGTPQVQPGDVVRKGQVLILGQERTQKGELRAVQAQGQVRARTWAQGSARVSLQQTQTVETGDVRTRVVLHSPWHTRVLRDAQPFSSQDVSTRIEPVIGLYLPLWREITTYAQTAVTRIPRDRGDAASWAQGAAEEIAKKQCPFDAMILDKTVDYSMIDNEFLYATVVLEYETAIAGRLK